MKKKDRGALRLMANKTALDAKMCLSNLAAELKGHRDLRKQAFYAVCKTDDEAVGSTVEVRKAFEEFLQSTHDHSESSIALTASVVEATCHKSIGRLLDLY